MNMGTYKDTDYTGGYLPDRPRQPVIPAAAERPEPPGIHLERGQQRASTVLRERYHDALLACKADGRLDEATAAARLKASRQAVTEADLRLLLEDLPGLPLPEEKPETWRQKRRRLKEEGGSIWKRSDTLRLLTYIVMIGLGTAGIVAAAVDMGDRKIVPVWGYMAGLTVVIAGIILVVWGILLMATDKMWHDDKKRSWT